MPVQHEHGQSSAVLRLIPVIITNIPSCISPLPISAFCSLNLKSELKVRIDFFLFWVWMTTSLANSEKPQSYKYISGQGPSDPSCLDNKDELQLNHYLF